MAIGLATITLSLSSRADEAADSPDKSQYNLFNRTPSDRLRPLSLDANDGVVDPTTVDAGHVLVQGSLVDFYRYTQDYNAGTVHFAENQFAWSPRISLGVLNNVDVFLHPSFHVSDYQYTGYYHASGNSSGFDQINIGAKVNLWGNDHGMTAFSVAPYVSIPNDNRDVLGGGDISFAIRLPDQFYLKIGTDPYAFASTHNTVFFGMENSMSLHKTVNENLDTYLYVNTVWESRDVEWHGYAGFGVSYQILENLEAFVGIGIGLTDNSYDYNPRLGLGWRF